MPAAVTPHGVRREAQSAERADDLRLHVLDLGVERKDALIDARFLLRLGLELRVTAKALGRLGEVLELFVDHRLIEHGGWIVRLLLLRFLKCLQRALEIVLPVEELTAVEQLDVILIGLTFLLQLALKLELEKQLLHVRLLGAARKKLNVAIAFDLRFAISSCFR